MDNLTQEIIEELITCPKIITDRPKKKPVELMGHLRNSFKMRALNDEREFSAFLRVNNVFQESFSIGLVYHPAEYPESLILLRCNCPHNQRSACEDIHWTKTHIHKATEKAIKENRNITYYADETGEYATWEEALEFFISRCNIENGYDFFPRNRQLYLPLEGD